jgi:hypothetical protein
LDTYLVSIFKLAVVLAVLLDCVVGQVDESVRNVFYVVVSAGGSQVALSVVVALQVPVNSLSDGKQTNIEFAVFIQKGFLAVFLNNVAALLSVNVGVRYNTLNLRKLLAHRDTTSSVRVLTRLYNPDAAAHCGELRQVRVVLWIVVRLLELGELGVRCPILYVIRQRQHIECVLVGRVIVNLHIVVNRLFITQMEIVLLMIVS